MSTQATREARRQAYQIIEPHISETQGKILQGIQDFLATVSRHPQYEELAISINIKPVSCNARLVKLRKDGYVKGFNLDKPMKPGTIQVLTKKGFAKLKEMGL